MSSDEDDYMSTKFLEANTANQQLTYTEKRRKQLHNQQLKSYIKPRAQLEQEAREEGLNRAMDSENKGMKLMMKMGFKAGMTLGKNESAGIHEPISVELKKGRQGLGMESSVKRSRDEQEAQEVQESSKRVALDPMAYRDAMAERAKEGKLTRRIGAGASLCKKLDEEAGIESNVLWALVPKPITEEEDKNAEEGEEEEEECSNVYSAEDLKKLKESSSTDKLDRIIKYLRDNYAYCFWCGARYDSPEDLKENCPGEQEDDH
ncbi:hypothetical protein CLU79DRAFT_756604 [Phycomyces nitens]|nr:hypothetical protein CLU79DRAFT_756604 [Phycomyces nitens]